MAGVWYTYIMANPASTVLYIGVTGDLARSVAEHKSRCGTGFTATYNATALVFYGEHSSPQDAIGREKQLKGWRRERKIALIRDANPDMRDLSLEW